MPHFFDKPDDHGYVKSFDGMQIYWEHIGAQLTDNTQVKQTPILFCYGLGCSKYQWRNTCEEFYKERPCIFFDYRGHHKSEYSTREHSLTMSDLARDAATVLRHLEISKAHIFGHSMGCNVALELAFQEPELVETMVLVAGSAINPFSKMLGLNVLDKIVSPLLESFPTNRNNFYLFWKWLLKNRALLKLVVMMNGFNRKAVTSDDIETYLDSIASVSPRVFFELLTELSRGNTATLLRRIITPTLVVSGGNDQVTPPEIQRHLAKDLPNAEYFSVPLGSHNVQLEFSDYLARKIREFWSKLPLMDSPKPVIRKKREKKSDRH